MSLQAEISPLPSKKSYKTYIMQQNKLSRVCFDKVIAAQQIKNLPICGT